MSTPPPSDSLHAVLFCPQWHLPVPASIRIVSLFVANDCQTCFYSAAALLAMQSAVSATAILSVCLSHAGTLSRRMKIGRRGLHCEVAKTL